MKSKANDKSTNTVEGFEPWKRIGPDNFDVVAYLITCRAKAEKKLLAAGIPLKSGCFHEPSWPQDAAMQGWQVMFASTSAIFDQFQPMTPREIEIAWLGVLAGRGTTFSGFGKEIEARRKRRAATPGMKAKLRARGRKKEVVRDVVASIVKANNRIALSIIFFDVGSNHNLPASTVRTYWYKTPNAKRKRAIAKARLLEQG